MEQGLFTFVFETIEDGILFLIRVTFDSLTRDFVQWVLLLLVLAIGFVVWRKITRKG